MRALELQISAPIEPERWQPFGLFSFLLSKLPLASHGCPPVGLRAIDDAGDGRAAGE